MHNALQPYISIVQAPEISQPQQNQATVKFIQLAPPPPPPPPPVRLLPSPPPPPPHVIK